MPEICSIAIRSGRAARLLAAFFVITLAITLPAKLHAQKALILTDTVTGGASSNEANYAAMDGFTVTVVDDATWTSMNTAQFAAYQVIIFGDPTCTVGTSPITTPLANTATWGAAVNGNVVVIGTDPTYHYDAGTAGAGQLMQSAIAFAGAQKGKTGVYASLSCEYAYSPDGTAMSLLDGVAGVTPGSFTLIGLNGAGLCYNEAHIVASSPSLSGLVDNDLDNWSCSVHEAFDTWPPSFEVLGIAEGFGTSYTASDGTVGDPYILSKGATVISNISLTPLTASDTVGGTQKMTATTTYGGSVVAGTTVTFTVVAGPDNGQTGTGVTNASGQAVFTLKNSPAATGTDFVKASFTDPGGIPEFSGNAQITWNPVKDTTPPSCQLTGTVAGPPKQIIITVKDTGSGLESVVVTQHVNSTVSVPSFTSGTTSAEKVTATKLDQSESSDVTLKVTDVAGNVTSCDPVDMTLTDNGIRGEHTFTRIPNTEHFIELSAGLVKVDKVDILVNGKLFREVSPGFNIESVDVARAMKYGHDNVITIWAYGARGGQLRVLIHD
jgi:hypothetical protein